PGRHAEQGGDGPALGAGSREPLELPLAARQVTGHAATGAVGMADGDVADGAEVEVGVADDEGSLRSAGDGGSEAQNVTAEADKADLELVGKELAIVGGQHRKGQASELAIGGQQQSSAASESGEQLVEERAPQGLTGVGGLGLDRRSSSAS